MKTTAAKKESAIGSTHQSRSSRSAEGQAWLGLQSDQAGLSGAQSKASQSASVAQLQALQDRANNSQAQSALRAASSQAQNHTGMPDQLKAGVESLSGISLDHVKVHYNSARPAQLHAHAYAQGSEIHLAPGQEKHLPHEAWHVVQQAQGRVAATVQAKGVAINDQEHLETEADQMGARALATGGTAQLMQVSSLIAGKNCAGVAQLEPDDDEEDEDEYEEYEEERIASKSTSEKPGFFSRMKSKFTGRASYARIGAEKLDAVDAARVAGRRAAASGDDVRATRTDDFKSAGREMGLAAAEIGLDKMLPGAGYAVSVGSSIKKISDAKKQGKSIAEVGGKEVAGIALGFVPVVGEFVDLVSSGGEAIYAGAESDEHRTARKLELAEKILKDGPEMIERLLELQGDLAEMGENEEAERVAKAIRRIDEGMVTARDWYHKKMEKGKVPLLEAEAFREPHGDRRSAMDEVFDKRR